MKNLGEIAYHKLDGSEPTVIFLHGFRSDMEGAKALFLESLCREIGHSFIRFDCFGHGKSAGDFRIGTIGQWTRDTLNIIDTLTTGEVILIGSSMGGWLMLLAALARPERIKALVGIAAAPDFTEELMWKKFSEHQQQEMITEGEILIPNCYEDQAPYPITHNLIDEARQHLLLNKPIDIHCPVRLLHGVRDKDVPYQFSLVLSECLASNDVEVHLVKNGDHRMSQPENLELLRQQVLSIIKA